MNKKDTAEPIYFDELDEFIAEMEKRQNWLDRWLTKKFYHGIAGYNPYYVLKPWNLWRIPECYYRRAKTRWIRGKKGWAPSDAHNLDLYLLSMLPDAIAYINQNKCSYPSEDMGEANWEETLVTIELGLNDGRLYAEGDEREELRQKFDEAWALMGKYFFDLYS